MADIVLSDINQADYAAAEQLVIALARTEYPNLDLRTGTVLREQLIRPAAMFYALDDKRLAELRSKMSLATLPDTATVEDANALLSNFNMTQNVGMHASGSIMVYVDSDRTYTIAQGTEFAVLEGGLKYVTTQAYTARRTPAAGELQLLNPSSGVYAFTLPLTAAEPGAAYDAETGTAMTPVTSIYGFLSASVYAPFTGGTDGETVAQAKARIPAALSQRSLTNRLAIEARLRDAFDATLGIRALSVQGMGDSAQLRDKHSINGIAVGSRIDIYPRTFQAPNVVTLTKTGTLVSPNTYQFTIDRADAPGYYAVRSISEPSLTEVSSYAYSEARSTAGLEGTGHDIVNTVESAFTAYQASVVTVTGVPVVGATHDFAVQLYTTPGLADIQAYVDDNDIRSLEADIVVRCPLLCLVKCSATVYKSAASSFDTAAVAEAVAAYVNGRSFVGSLSRAEIANVILDVAGATRVDLGLTGKGMQLEGRILDAQGTWHTLAGDVLSIDDVEAAQALLTRDTCVFACTRDDITLTVISE